MPTASAARPFTEKYLVAYSAEHGFYEFDMFLWLAGVCGTPRTLGGPTKEEAARLSNVLIESFAVHLRNVIDFLYGDRPQATDVVAADFLNPGDWQRLRPSISSQLDAARIRATKEVAHLTTDRITGTTSAKAWAVTALSAELKVAMELFAAHAVSSRLSPNVGAAIRRTA